MSPFKKKEELQWGDMKSVSSSHKTASDCPPQPLTSENKKPNPQQHCHKVFSVLQTTMLCGIISYFKILRLSG